jgi:glutamyl-tRNA reductase
MKRRKIRSRKRGQEEHRRKLVIEKLTDSHVMQLLNEPVEVEGEMGREKQKAILNALFYDE